MPVLLIAGVALVVFGAFVLLRETEEFSNVSRTSDKRTLQNFDTLRVQLGGRFYEVRFGGGATIRLNFTRVNP